MVVDRLLPRGGGEAEVGLGYWGHGAFYVEEVVEWVVYVGRV